MLCERRIDSYLLKEKSLIRTFIKFSIMSLLFTVTRTTIHKLKRPA